MIKKIYLPLMLLMTLAFVGCNKDMKPLSADYFTAVSYTHLTLPTNSLV